MYTMVAMNNWRRTSLLIIFLLAFVFIKTAYAGDGMTSEHFVIPWSIVGSGGGTMVSENYLMKATLGQSVVEFSCSQHFKLGSGFWFGIVGILPPCSDFANVFLPLVLQE